LDQEMVTGPSPSAPSRPPSPTTKPRRLHFACRMS